MISLPKKVTKKFYIHLLTTATSHDENCIIINEWSLTHSNDYILLGEVEVDIPVPQVETAEHLVEKLKAQKQKLLADIELRCQQIDFQINALLCIEHKNN